MKLPKQWLWPILLGAALLVGLGFAFWPRAVAVDVATLREGPMMVTVEDDGVTRIREVYVLSAPIAGRMLRVDVHAGDFIEARKTAVATIEPIDPAFLDARSQRQLESTVSAARAARDLAAATVNGREADLRLAKQELDRVRPLFAKGVVAKARLDTAEATLAAGEAALTTAKAALRQADFQVKTAEAALIVPSDTPDAGRVKNCCYTVRAPIDGQVLRVLNESAGVIQAGQPLAEVGDTNDLEIVVDLLSTEAVKVQPGDPVLITRWGGEGALNGKVRRVEPFGFLKVSSLGIEERRVNVIIDLTDPRERWRRLGHGYQIDAAIVRWQSANVLQVPVGALFRQGADWAVFRIDGSRARLTTIKVGHINDETAEVTSGLSAGDRVVSHPSEQVSDGVAVTAR